MHNKEMIIINRSKLILKMKYMTERNKVNMKMVLSKVSQVVQYRLCLLSKTI